MNQFNEEEQFNCNYGCQNENQCQYYNNLPPQHVQNTADNTNYYGNSQFDEPAVAPINLYVNQQIPNYQNQTTPQLNGYFIDNVQSYPPCQGPQPWNYAQCYGYYGEAPCQFANVVDMEDFM